MLRAGMIGFGGIAQAHKNGYKKLEKDGIAKLVAVQDIRKEAFEGKVEINLKLENGEQPSDIHFYTDLEEMLANEQLDYIDICVPTYLHKGLAIKMLRRGYPVISEKPMALTYADCQEMLAAERESGKPLMVAQCLRFFPEYVFLKECLEKGTYGRVQAAYFNRESAMPVWGWENWFMDYNKAGGVITDMHIHDIDMVRWLFGEPEAVSCRATDVYTKYDIVQTALHYPGLPVTACSAWTAGRIGFSATYRVDFAEASVMCAGGKVTVYPKDGEKLEPQLSGYDGYTGEIAYFCDVILGKIENTRNPASSAAQTLRLIDRMKESADQNGVVLAF